MEFTLGHSTNEIFLYKWIRSNGVSRSYSSAGNNETYRNTLAFSNPEQFL